MTGKEKFIQVIEQTLEDCPDFFGLDEEGMAATTYFRNFVNIKENKLFTEKGIQILTYMQENNEKCGGQFKAKELGEGLFIAPRAISGSMRKLVNDGYVNKIGKDPVIYELTELGESATFN